MLMRSMLMLVALIAFFVTGCVQETVCVGGAEEIDGVCVLPDGAAADSGASDSGGGDGAIDSGSMDGGVDSGASDTGVGTDSGAVTDSGSDTGDSGTPMRYVFVTSERYQGLGLGGVAMADDHCVRLAATPGGVPEGNYVAWLSTATDAAKDRVGPGTGGWKLVAPAGGSDEPTVAMSLTDLTDGSIGNAINRDESGVSVVAAGVGEPVFTGTGFDGTLDVTSESRHCGNWGEAGATDLTVMAGRTNQTDDGTLSPSDDPGFQGWTSGTGGAIPCNTMARIYCFQVE